MKTFNVELLAFNDSPGIFREVDVPDGDSRLEPNTPTEALLEAIFYYGQNDFQLKQGCYSVSMGDVAHIGNDKWHCSMVGWKKLTEEQYQEYRNMKQQDRLFHQQ